MADEKEYGTPVSFEELKGHYEIHFMDKEYFGELLATFIKQAIPTEKELEMFESGGYSSHPDDCVREGAQMIIDRILEQLK